MKGPSGEVRPLNFSVVFLLVLEAHPSEPPQATPKEEEAEAGYFVTINMLIHAEQY